MFGGLKKTSSRIAIAAAFGVAFGGFAMSTPAQAGGLGGDCCADLEERVAELEATTVRKGNKKVSVTVSGWVVKSMNWWDGSGGTDPSGRELSGSGFVVGDKDYDLASRFAITGSATIAPGWTAGYNLTVTAGATTWGIAGNQFDEYNSVNGLLAGSPGAGLGGGNFASINTLYSFIYIKSDTWGALNWGHLSPASDNPAVLADISGTVIESNFVGFEGGGFFVKPSGQKGVTSLTFNAYWLCTSGAAPGADCFGTAQPAVRYDSPTWGGFRFETSYGTYDVAGPYLNGTPDQNFWDIALIYNKDWGNWRVAAAGAYTWLETSAAAGNAILTSATAGQQDIYQVGGTIMHVPSGLGVYATGNWETGGGSVISQVSGTRTGISDTDSWGVKPFFKSNWSPLGATTLFGEYAQYNDFFAAVAGVNHCGAGIGFGTGSTVGNFCAANLAGGTEVTGSEIERWGVGVVQEIDAAAMHLWARWQHQELDVDFVGVTDSGARRNLSQGFEDFDFFQVGGIIFF